MITISNCLFQLQFSRRYWETSVSIFPLLDSISNDQEPAVRQHLMEQLALLAQVNVLSLLLI